jgi:Prp8 binding protein
MDSKRGAEGYGGQLVKRARFDGDDGDDGSQQIVVSSDAKGRGQLVANIKRTSGLSAPIVKLQGHGSEVLDVAFDARGEVLASASTDKSINLWKVYGEGESANFGVLKGQQGAITSIAFPVQGSPHLFAASTDKTVATFNTSTGELVRRHRGHQGIVNCVDVTRGGRSELIASASDDGLIKIWDVEAKNAIDEVELGYPVTAVQWSQDGQQLFIGGIDNDIHVRTVLSFRSSVADLICPSTVFRYANKVCSILAERSQRHRYFPRLIPFRYPHSFSVCGRHTQDLGRAAVCTDCQHSRSKRPSTPVQDATRRDERV